MVECKPQYGYILTDNGWSDRRLDFDETKRFCRKKKREIEERDGVHYEFSKGAQQKHITIHRPVKSVLVERK